MAIVTMAIFSAACVYGQVENTLYSFTNGTDSSGPLALISDGHGNFFGTTMSGIGTVFELSPAAGGGWSLTTLYTFPNGNPSRPRGLVMDAAGNLYGVAQDGGSTQQGTVFELSPNGSGGWTQTTLYQFHGSDGQSPNDLTLDSAGNLYGTTNSGGKCPAFSVGCGIAFELGRQSDGSWSETILHRFGAFPEDGQFPEGGLARDSQGNLYGTTSVGGKTGCSTTTCGTLFELTKTGGKWYEKILHFFHSIDGAFPLDTPTLDAAGNVYGTTPMGGAYDAGVVFKLAPTSSGGWQIHLVHSFSHFTTGVFPVAGVTLDAAGNIYAATQDGGISGRPCLLINSVAGCGSVWQFSPSSSGQWTPTLLYVFTGGSDGRILDQNLVRYKGRLFGTATYGGTEGFGTVFEITPE